MGEKWKYLLGTDIIEISRIKSAIEKEKDNFLKTIYTEKEIKYCESRNKNKYQSYAARFAAKEAIYKALNSEIDSNISWLDVEVIDNKNGKPKIQFLNNKYEQIVSADISLSHCKEYAVATVLVLCND